MALITCENLKLGYEGKAILENLSFTIESGDYFCIVGENGSGKTAIILAVNIMRNIMIDKSYLSDSMNQKLLVESVNKKTMSGFIECEYYVTNDTERHIYKYYISFEIRDDDRFYLIN